MAISLVNGLSLGSQTGHNLLAIPLVIASTAIDCHPYEYVLPLSGAFDERFMYFATYSWY